MRIAIALALGVLLTTTEAAADCPVTLGFRPSQVSPCDTIGTFPPNGILRARKPGSLWAQELLLPDTDINGRFACSARENTNDCVPVVRVQGAQLGNRFLSTSYTGCVTDLVIDGEPDRVAPPAPFIAAVTVDLVTSPDACDVDSLGIRVDNVLDDQAPARLLQLAVYVGATEDEARNTRQIEHMLEVYDGTTSVTLTANLGRSQGRARPIARGLLAAGPHCFAVETVDWAGNFSPRSAPVCVDHTNEDDPHVKHVAGTDTESCASSPRAPSSTWLLAGLALVAYRLRRKRR